MSAGYADPLSYLNPVAGFQSGFQLAQEAARTRLARTAEDRRKVEADRQFGLQQEEGTRANTRLANDEVLVNLNRLKLDELKQDIADEKEDLIPFHEYQVKVENYLPNPIGPPPVVPILKSKSKQAQAQEISKRLDPFSKLAQMKREAERNISMQQDYDIDRVKLANRLFPVTGINAVEIDENGIPRVNEEKWALANQKAPEFRDQTDYSAERFKGIEPIEAMRNVAASRPKDAKVQNLLMTLPPRIGALKSVGIEVGDDEVDAFVGSLSTPGAANIPQTTLTQWQAADTIINGFEGVNKRIEKFNEKFLDTLGPNAFGKMIGPVSGRIEKEKTAILKPELLSEATKAANEIKNSIALLPQPYRKANFGSNFTKLEKDVFAQFLAEPTAANYLQTAKTFPEDMRLILNNELSNRKLAPNAPFTLLKKYIGNPEAAQAVEGGGAPITREQAAQFMIQAGGDKEQARKLARDAGFKF
jgi:hypothetical protein